MGILQGRVVLLLPCLRLGSTAALARLNTAKRVLEMGMVKSKVKVLRLSLHVKRRSWTAKMLTQYSRRLLLLLRRRRHWYLRMQ